jgi:phosphoglycolate phosphatase
MMDDPLRLAVFDLDGTLVDSQHMISAAMGRAFKAAGLAVPPREAVRRIVGLSLDHAVEQLSLDMGIEHDCHAEIGEGYKKHFFELRDSGEHPEELFSGVREVLTHLDGAGWLLGIATGKTADGLHSTLDHFDLAGHFLTLQNADGGPGKPAPHMLERAITEAGARAENTVMIGDTSFDMEMACAAKVAGIGVSWGYHERQDLVNAGAGCIIDDFSDLPKAAELALIKGAKA